MPLRSEQAHMILLHLLAQIAAAQHLRINGEAAGAYAHQILPARPELGRDGFIEALSKDLRQFLRPLRQRRQFGL